MALTAAETFQPRYRVLVSQCAPRIFFDRQMALGHVLPSWAVSRMRDAAHGRFHAALDARNNLRHHHPMSESPEYLTTKELAELLRIKERKVYDMAADGDVPCVRVVGKLLFPRSDIDAWITAGRSGPRAPARALPPIFVGSHDPLLDWALRASQCGLAAFFDGSLDGLERVAKGDAIGCATHIHESGGWNTATVAARAGELPVVLVEFARRERGLIVANEKAGAVATLADMRGLRVARRQSSAASQALLETLLQEVELTAEDVRYTAVARTEDEAALMVHEDQADVAFGLRSMATRLGLSFVPVLEERLDLLFWRRAYFEPPVQRLLQYLRGAEFQDRCRAMGGYDVSRLGTVHLNGAGE